MKISLTLLTLLFCLVVGVELVLWQPAEPTEVPEPSAHPMALTNLMPIETHPEFRLPGIKLYRDITERPLFAKARRPADHIHSTRQAPHFPDDYVLQGMFYTDRRPTAIVFNKKSHEKSYLTTGQQIAGWRILQITSSGLTLARGPYQKIMRLEEAAVRE